MKRYLPLLLPALVMTGCSDDEHDSPLAPDLDPAIVEQYYAGGRLGTATITSSKAYEQPTPAVEQGGLFLAFNRGEKLFEKPFTANTIGGEREGLGPLYVRSSCLHCHPGYGHGKSQPDGAFNTVDVGNGYLLVVYDPSTDAYVKWLAGMPQTHAVAPFKDPIDESQIQITWHEFTDQWGNRFPDGETYALRYPEVTIPREAVYVIGRGYEDATTRDYAVRLESTLGIYGSGLLDAIPDDSIVAQYDREYADGHMTNGFNFYSDGQYTGFYSNSRQGDGTKYVRRFTYALSRGPLLDAAGANAIWNITNVTRSDRRYHYLDLDGKIYARYASQDPDVQAGFDQYIRRITSPAEHPEYFTADVERNIYSYLTAQDLPVEMSDQDYSDFMVWHRGLAVPAARRIDDPKVQRGREVFTQIGCAYCHRPSWTTGEDRVADPNLFQLNAESGKPVTDYSGSLAARMPRYPNQKIWPYTDMVQHKLFMKNDIRTGWCRTTALWGRGLHQLCTGSPYADRLHDCRARNVIEAIMWHATNVGGQSDAAYSVERFRQLSKDDRDAVVEFVDAI